MSLSQNQIKFVRALGQKKFRQKYQYFTAEGDKIAREILTHKTYSIYQIYAISAWIETNEDLLRNIDAPVFEINTKQLKQISFLKTPNNVMIVLEMPTDMSHTRIATSGLHFYLDDIRDPGNMGSIIRIALWFGFRSVVASASCVDYYNQKVIQATMGAFLHLPLFRSDSSILSGRAVVTTDMSGHDITEVTELPKDAFIVIGNEGRGISAEVMERSTLATTIPCAGATDKIDSLNAAVSAGIVAAFFSRK